MLKAVCRIPTRKPLLYKVAVLTMTSVMLIGCQGASDPCAAYDSNATEPLASVLLAGVADRDGIAVLEPGPQGGYHMYLDARTEGVCPSEVQVELELRVAKTGDFAAAMPFARTLVPDNNSPWFSTDKPILFQICPTNKIDVLDRDLSLAMTVRDKNGNSAFSEKTIQLHCPTGNPSVEQTCQYLCNSASAN